MYTCYNFSDEGYCWSPFESLLYQDDDELDIFLCHNKCQKRWWYQHFITADKLKTKRKFVEDETLYEKSEVWSTTL